MIVDTATTDNRFPVESAVVMPHLNEIYTLATCANKAQRALQESEITGL
jgi:hypothetical protein